MGKDERKGARRDRNLRSFKRVPELGYYFVVTDARETEVNYLHGFRDSITLELRDRLVLRVLTASTFSLLEKCLEMAAVEPQYRKPWIIFDRDQVKDFDQIIANAEQKNVSVGWSNPCLEIWFHAYLAEMPINAISGKCIEAFASAYRKTTGNRYNKTDADIYRKLCKLGDERTAINTAKRRYQQYDSSVQPSKMLSATTLYMLIDEIRRKTEAQE